MNICVCNRNSFRSGEESSRILDRREQEIIHLKENNQVGFFENISSNEDFFVFSLMISATLSLLAT